MKTVRIGSKDARKKTQGRPTRSKAKRLLNASGKRITDGSCCAGATGSGGMDARGMPDSRRDVASEEVHRTYVVEEMWTYHIDESIGNRLFFTTQAEAFVAALGDNVRIEPGTNFYVTRLDFNFRPSLDVQTFVEGLIVDAKEQGALEVASLLEPDAPIYSQLQGVIDDWLLANDCAWDYFVVHETKEYRKPDAEVNHV